MCGRPAAHPYATIDSKVLAAMSDTLTPPVAPAPAEATTRWWRRNIVVIPVVAVVAFSMGASGSEGAPATTATSSDEALLAQISELEDALAQAETSTEADADGIAEREAAADARDRELTAREEALDAQAEEPAPEPEAAPAPDEGMETYTAGSFSIEDVQVREDGLGDLEVRARVTNNGGDNDMVMLKATLFRGGTMIGTAEGMQSDFPAGETRSMEFISLDDFSGDYDSIEFQVEASF
jgi:hypothetical protein